ncbi:MAG: hypothetical protein HOP33_00850, partial [Verrucomicrobia bacterium]|nr:hypothetical protein [Verrucomicrobiota bacterium]
TNRYLFLGRIGSGTLAVTTGADATFNVDSYKSFGIGLGDLNRDGYDDFALFRASEDDGPYQGSALIFYGSASYKTLSGLARTAADAAFRILMKPAGSLAGGLSVRVKGFGITAGDFNADGKLDLAVGAPSVSVNDINGVVLDQENIGQVAIFWSVAQHVASTGKVLLFSQADVLLEGTTEQDQFGALPLSPGLDLNRDGIHDLVIGTPAASAIGAGIVRSVGTVSIIYGAAPIDPRVAANQTNAVVLTNRTITGSGDFLIELQPGQPFVYTGTLPSGSGENWYRYTTLGDGEAGTQIVLLPASQGVRTVLMRGEDGRISAAGQVQLGSLLNLGVEAGDAVVLEFDLSSYLDMMSNVNGIQQVLLTLGISVNFPTVPTDSVLTFVNNLLFFPAQPAGPTNQLNTELWKTDMTVLGTTVTRDINHASIFTGQFNFPLGSFPQNFTQVGSLLYFTATDSTPGTAIGTELWKSDGTTAGTVVARDIVLGSGSSNPSNLTNVNGVLFFTANTSTNGTELWRSDAVQGAVLVRDINTFFGGTASSTPANLANVNGVLYFTADDGTNGIELWRSDGTSVGTVRVETVNRLASFLPQNLTNVNGTLYFTAADNPANGTELWKSNGTAAGTLMVRNINGFLNGSSSPTNLTNVNGIVYFTADDGTHGVEMWRSDGTLAGTVRLADVNVSFAGLSNFNQLTAVTNALYFTAFESATGIELWNYDATANNLQRLTDIVAGPGTGNPQALTVRGTTLFFSVDPGTGRQELWKTDGTPATTVLVSNNGGEGFLKVDVTGRPAKLNLTTNGTTLAFTAISSTGENEIWLSDGTTAGTKRLSDSGLLDRTLQVRALDAEGDGAVTATDRTAPATGLATQYLRDVAGNTPVTVDVTTLVRAALQAGRTRLTLRLQLDSPNAANPLVIHSTTNPLQGTGLSVSLAAVQGVVADVFDNEGRRLAEGQTIIDTRAFAAGTYFLRIYNPAGAQQSGALPYSIEVTAPKAGVYHSLSDHDEIHGGDGSDILIGNQHLDRLFGEGGDDDFIGEDVEARDLENRGLANAELKVNPISNELITNSQISLKPLNPSIDSYIHEDALRLALARALDIPITTSFGGVPIARGTITAAQMATLTRLDLNGLHLSDVSGVEFATNLRVLGLSSNEVVDLAIIAPHAIQNGAAAGNQAGLGKLEYLSLDYTQLANASRLADFTKLKGFTADGKPALGVTLPATTLNGTLLRQIANPSVVANDLFGFAISVFGNFAVISAPYNNTGANDAGIAYVFDVANGQLLWTLNNPSPASTDNFGYAVAISNGLIAIGTPFHDEAGNNNSGAVYIFDLRTGLLRTTLLNPATTSPADDYFGVSLSMSGDLLAVGAMGNNEAGVSNAGAVYVFDARTGELRGTFRKTTPVAGDQFGTSVAISSTQLLVGAPFDDTTATDGGAAYLYDLTNPASVRVIANPVVETLARFGSAVGLSGLRAVIGSLFQNVGSVVDAGAAYLYDTGDSLTWLRTLTNPTPGSSDLFGNAVAIKGDAVLVAAYADDATFTDSGAVHVFDASNGALVRTLEKTKTITGGLFGYAVGMSGGVVVGGAVSDNTGATQAGAAYLFESGRLVDPTPFGSLTNLQFLSLSNNYLTGVAPLADLTQLQILDLDNNRIGDISPLIGQRILDDLGTGYTETSLIAGLPAGWQGNINPASAYFGGHYRFHTGSNGAVTSQAVWEFTGLAPGTYQVLVTWSGQESHASNAQFTTVAQQFDANGNLADNSQSVRLNQRLAPVGTSFGGRMWQSVAIVISDGTSVRVLLTDDANGTVVADAVRIVKVDAVTKQPLAALPNLLRLTLTGNPLDDNAHQIVVPVLVARDVADTNFTFSYTANLGLQWQTLFATQSMAQGGTLLLQFLATDGNAGDSIFYSATSNNPNVSVSISGNQLTVTGAANFMGTVRITMVAQDGPSGPGDSRGRRVEQSFDLNVGVSAVTGTKWLDLNNNGVRDGGEPGLEGVTVFLDLNGNGVLDNPAVPTATTPWFTVDHLTGGSLLGSPFSGFLAFDAQGRLYISDSNFTNDRIHRYDPVTHTFGPFTPDTGSTQEARGPESIAFGADGALYVASNFDRNIRIYDGQTGAFIAETWSDGSGTLFSDDGMMAPGPGGNILFIVDFNPAVTPIQILRYDTLTRSLLTNFVINRVAGVFNDPSDITIGPDGNIYIADKALGSVVRLNGTTGAVMPAPGQTGAVFVAPGTAGIGINPKLAFDPAGILHVASSTDFIMGFNGTTGALIGSVFAGKRSAAPLDMIFDAAGRLYLSVSGDRVLLMTRGEPVTLTDTNGAYAFNGLVPATYTVAELIPASSTQTYDLGTSPVSPVDINPGAGSGSPTGFVLFNNRLYFGADGGDGAGFELWSYDGKTVSRVADIEPGAGSSGPYGLTVFNNALHFGATTTAAGTELWRYDGVSVTQVPDINSGVGSSFPTGMFVFNNLLVFNATGGFGSELYWYDGTNMTFTDINLGPTSSAPGNFAIYDNVLYYSATDASSGRELWRFTGGAASRVADTVSPGVSSSSPADLFAFGGFLYFSATDNGTVGRELYRYNGSSVSLAANIHTGAGNSSSPTNLTAFNGSLYFTAFTAASGTELWRYTNPVLTSIPDINPGAGSSTPLSLTVLNNALYFSATDGGGGGTFGRELWRYDGATRERISDINTGTLSSSPSNFIVFDDALYFAATDQNTVGNELWRYDGAVTLAADINPGFPFSSPTLPVIFDGSLFIRADGPTQGTELWRYTVRRVTGQHTVVLPVGQIATNRDFGNFRVVDIGSDLSANEATQVGFSATVVDPNSGTPSTFTYLWQVVGDNGQIIPNSSANTLIFTPNDNGIYTVTLAVTDSADGKVYQDSAIVSVANVAPGLPSGINASQPEGSTFTRLISFTDPGADVWAGTIDYGDGSAVSALTGLTPVTPLSILHTYADDGQYTVTVTISDDDGGTATQSFLLTVNNTAPVVNAGADRSVTEGTPVTLIANVSDAGVNDPLTSLWSVVASNGQVIAPFIGDSFTFTPLDNGIYTVTVTVEDEDHAITTDQVVVTVTNVAPTLSLDGASTITEGTPYTLTLGAASDLGADTVTQYRVSWGDGSLLEIFSNPGSVTHTFLNQGTPIISVSLVDEDGTHVNVATKALTVQNVVAVLNGITLGAASVFENSSLTLTGSFTDPGTQDGHTVKILWGDGTVEQNVVLAAGVTEFTVVHQYLDDNPTGTGVDVCTIVVRVNDGSVDSATLTTNVTVSNLAPTFGSLTSGTTLIEGQSLTLNGNVGDVGTQDVHTVTVDWGDGSALQVLSLNPAKAFSGSHVYSIPGVYSVVTTALDDDGGIVLNARAVTVEDLAPIIATANFGSVSAGVLFVRTGSFTDLTGPEDSWTATVNYDGGPLLPLALNANGSFDLQHVFSNAGAHNITVVVLDRFGRSDTKTFGVNVQSVPPPPSIVGLVLNGGLSQRSRMAGINVQFTSNVSASLSTADFVLRNLTTSLDVPAANLALNFDSGTNTLTILLAPGVILPAGNYHLTVLAAGIADTTGQSLVANGSLDFHLLPGDANGDRMVNDLDLFQVWQDSLHLPGQQSPNNDLTGDGLVNSSDVNLVRSNYLTKLPSVAVLVLETTINNGHAQRSWLEQLAVTFSENIGASLSLADVRLRNLNTSTDVATTSLTVSFDATTRKLVLGLAPGVVLPEGNYRLTLSAAGITDGGGRALDADVVVDFHILTGDANGDRIVNDLDLYLVWQGLLQPPANRDLQYDLNHDGGVTLADVDVVRVNYLAVLSDVVPPPPALLTVSFVVSALAAANSAASNAGPSSPSQDMVVNQSDPVSQPVLTQSPQLTVTPTSSKPNAAGQTPTTTQTVNADRFDAHLMDYLFESRDDRALPFRQALGYEPAWNTHQQTIFTDRLSLHHSEIDRDLGQPNVFMHADALVALSQFSLHFSYSGDFEETKLPHTGKSPSHTAHARL